LLVFTEVLIAEENYFAFEQGVTDELGEFG